MESHSIAVQVNGARIAANLEPRVLAWPLACTASTVQDLTVVPSIRTVQAPHCEVSQPMWVPVRPACSRRK